MLGIASIMGMFRRLFTPIAGVLLFRKSSAFTSSFPSFQRLCFTCPIRCPRRFSVAKGIPSTIPGMHEQDFECLVRAHYFSSAAFVPRVGGPLHCGIATGGETGILYRLGEVLQIGRQYRIAFGRFRQTSQAEFYRARPWRSQTVYFPRLYRSEFD